TARMPTAMAARPKMARPVRWESTATWISACRSILSSRRTGVSWGSSLTRMRFSFTPSPQLLLDVDGHGGDDVAALGLQLGDGFFPRRCANTEDAHALLAGRCTRVGARV